MNRKEIQQVFKLKHEENFRENYLEPALADVVIEMKYSDSPKHPNQKYLLTEKGSKKKTVINEKPIAEYNK
jgi:ATP-dependent DNA helicase RecG